jgi:hypothetical protein
VKAAGAVAGFAAGGTGSGSAERDLGVGRGGKVVGLVGVTLDARLVPGERSASDIRWCDHSAVGSDAGDEQEAPSSCSSE